MTSFEDHTCKKAFRCGVKEMSTSTFTLNERPRAVRYRKASLRAPVKSNLRVEFTESGLTSYAGLELLVRYFRSIGLNAMIRRHMGAARLDRDYGTIPMVRLVLGLVVSRWPTTAACGVRTRRRVVPSVLRTRLSSEPPNAEPVAEELHKHVA